MRLPSISKSSGFIFTMPSFLEAHHCLVLLHSRAKAVQKYLEDFLGVVPLVLLFGHQAIQGCPFQVAGERIAFLFFCQVFFLKMQLHDFYPRIYTPVGFSLIPSRFLENPFGLPTAVTGFLSGLRFLFVLIINTINLVYGFCLCLQGKIS